MGTVSCAECGTVLHDGKGEAPRTVTGEGDVPRSPCPDCGSTRRTFEQTLSATVGTIASVSTAVQRAWNSDRLAVLLFLLALAPAVGLAVGFGVGSLVYGLVAGVGSVLVGAIVLWMLLAGPLASIAADAMYRISGR